MARDEELHREVALKQILDRHADDPDSRARFLVEAEITGKLEHPGVIPVYGLGHDPSGRPFYAMRLVKGESLKEAVARFHRAEGPGRDPRERALALRRLLGRFIAVCNTIAYAHSRGVIHRDLKPGNVLLGPFGETLVIDWGLAKVVGRPGVGPRRGRGDLAAGPGRQGGRDAARRDGRHAGLHEPGAGGRAPGRGGTGQRCVQPGRHALLPPDRQAARRGERRRPCPAAGPTGRVLAATQPEPGGRAGPGGDLPEGDGAQAEGPLPLTPRAGRCHRGAAGFGLREARTSPSRASSVPGLLPRPGRDHPPDDPLQGPRGPVHLRQRPVPRRDGDDPRGIKGKTDFDFFPRELAEKYRADDRRVLESRQVIDVVEQHVTPKGETLYVQTMKTPILGPDGEPIGIQGIFWDVTERIRAEEQLKEQNIALQQLAQSEHQAHEELKSP